MLGEVKVASQGLEDSVGYQAELPPTLCCSRSWPHITQKSPILMCLKSLHPMLSQLLTILAHGVLSTNLPRRGTTESSLRTYKSFDLVEKQRPCSLPPPCLLPGHQAELKSIPVCHPGNQSLLTFSLTLMHFYSSPSRP